MPDFYEFFAGGGMARAGLGKGWNCLFANDIDAKKGASYATNWGRERLEIRNVGELETTDLPGCADLAWRATIWAWRVSARGLFGCSGA